MSDRSADLGAPRAIAPPKRGSDLSVTAGGCPGRRSTRRGARGKPRFLAGKPAYKTPRSTDKSPRKERFAFCESAGKGATLPRSGGAFVGVVLQIGADHSPPRSRSVRSALDLDACRSVIVYLIIVTVFRHG